MKTFEQVSDLILDRNNHFIVANKPAGMSCMPDKTDEPNLKNLLEAYSKSNLYIITRLDRPVSGLILYAKKQSSAAALTEQLKSKSIQKTYWAIIEGHLDKKEGQLTHYLIKQGNKSKVSDANDSKAKKAELTYKVLFEYDRYTLLEIELITGRYHQIRSQLAAIGHPIKGDVKYGARRKNNDRSIYLHAKNMSFKHPGLNHESVSYESNPDAEDPLWKLVISKK